jgi:hypothetical protein
VATFSRSAQMARRADPPGPLFHWAIWTAKGSGAGAGTADAPATVEGGGTGAGMGVGTGVAVGSRALGQDPCRARREDDGAVFWGFARLAVAVPAGVAGRAAGPRLCLPPANENSPSPTAGSLLPRRR